MGLLQLARGCSRASRALSEKNIALQFQTKIQSMGFLSSKGSVAYHEHYKLLERRHPQVI